MKYCKATVISNNELLRYPGARYYLMRIKAPEIADACKPGQFLMIQCGSDTLLRRPLSVHEVIGSSEVHLLYTVPDTTGSMLLESASRSRKTRVLHNKGTAWLSNLKEGSIIDVLGPLGNYYQINPSAQHLLLVAGGIGIAPLKFLVSSALSLNKSVILLIGARYKEGIYPKEQLPSQVEVISVIENDTIDNQDKRRLVTNILSQYVDWADQIFACGPQAMYEEIDRQRVTWQKEKPIAISLEVRMGCGFGVCYGCSIKTKLGMKRVCKEGPVFNIKDIIWQEVKT